MPKIKIEFPREKTVFYFKVLFCIFLIGLWSFWFTNSSKESKSTKITKHNNHTRYKKRIKPVQIKQAEELFQSDEKEIKQIVNQNTPEITPATKKSIPISKIPDLKITKEKNNLQNKLLKELPELATLTPVKTNIEKNITEPKEKTLTIETNPKNKQAKKDEITIPKEMINLNLPNVASATRKVLLKNEEQKQEAGSNPTLRKVAPIEKNKLKPISGNLKENKRINLGEKIYIDDGWLPKYNEESKDAVENLDKIAEQIEVAGIVIKPNNESTVIIKNKLNNYIEILKKGDDYKGLKLLEINKSEVILGNQSLNKTYLKRINLGK